MEQCQKLEWSQNAESLEHSLVSNFGILTLEDSGLRCQGMLIIIKILLGIVNLLCFIHVYDKWGGES